MGQTEIDSNLRVTFRHFVSFFFSFYYRRMNLTVVIGLLLSAAMVLAKKPLKELTGVEAAAELEADAVIAQAANEQKAEAKMADEGEADSEEVNSAERNQADAYNRMMASDKCCGYCRARATCRARAKNNGEKKKCDRQWRSRLYGCGACSKC